MGFFSSDLGLAEQFANPKVERIYQPDSSNQPLSSSVFSDNPFETLANAISGGTGGTSGGFNMPWTPELGDGTISPGYSPTPTTPSPVTPTDTLMGSTTGPENVFGSSYNSTYDNTDYFGNQLSSLESYLQAKEATPGWQTTLASALVPGFGMLSTISDLAYGINPLGDLFGEGTQTFDNYEGSTDYFGNPYSDAALSSQYGGYADVFEQMAAYEDDLDALMDLMDESFNYTDVAPTVDYNVWDTFTDVTGGMFGDGFGDGTSSDTSSSDTSSTSDYGGNYGSGDSWDSGDYGGYDESWG